MRVGLMITATVLGLWAAPVTPALADSYVDCSSSGYGRNYCSVDARGRVWLDQQYSNDRGPCIENQTWGRDGRGIWVDRGCRGRFRVEDRYSGGGKDKDNTAAVVGGLLIGGLILGALASSAKNDSNNNGSSWSGDTRRAVDSCSNEALNQVSRYGSRARIDRITSARAQNRGYSVQGYVAADVGPRTVTYSFDCNYDGRYANVDLN
ncbi:MAG: DUF3011 domain-containing protein [Pseudomonadota bacterium]|uniref:DUF3011 domain-containing protein n=1 Tax=unclassified Phenylobacterium TaxID=2640670 RepID=UPI0006F79279|nr:MULTISPECIES: DUF3011 domain-containing protein [unclassified Phenylobacterium]KRB44586.1 hypothetical protein ASE02_02835 [Phenylobacterium sp. Root700]MBT9473052.1 DUF3011 domain-containing protein [Phenylobacterium sp.]